MENSDTTVRLETITSDYPVANFQWPEATNTESDYCKADTYRMVGCVKYDKDGEYISEGIDYDDCA